MDTEEVAAGTLVAFWTRPRTMDGDQRLLCVRLAQALDPAGALAAYVRENPDELVPRVGAALRAASVADPEVGGLVRQLAPRRALPYRWGALTTRGEPSTNPYRADRKTERDGPHSPRERRAGTSGVHERTDRSAGTRLVLFTAADPEDLDRLELSREQREIREALDLAAGPERWTLQPWMAARLRDFTRALLQLRPRIIHFAGHGSDEGGLFLENEVGCAQHIPPEALADLFSVVDGTVECVLLSACYSESQAQSISQYVPFVIGSPAAMEDEAAIAFAVGFYQALGSGCGIAQAYRVGCAHLRSANSSGLPLPILIRRR